MNVIRENSKDDCSMTNQDTMAPQIAVKGRSSSFGVLAVIACMAVSMTGCASKASVERASVNESTSVDSGESPDEAINSVLVETAQEAVSQGDRALEQGDFDRALYLYITALDLGGKDADTFFKIGLIHQRWGNSVPAALAFKSALKSDAGNAGAWEALGLIMLSGQYEDSAYESLTMAVALDPKRWRAHNGLGIIADLRHDYPTALSHYDSALKIESDSPVVFNNRGYSRYMAGEFDAAGHDFATALTLDSDFSRGWLNLALLELRRENYEQAYRNLKRIMDDAPAFNDMGYFSMLAGKHSLADKFFRESIRLSPSYNEVAHENIELNRELRKLNESDIPEYDHRPPVDVAPPIENRAFVEASRATLYEQPEKDAKALGELAGGTLVTVIATAGPDWAKVEHDDKEAGEFMQGWINEQDLIILPHSTVE